MWINQYYEDCIRCSWEIKVKIPWYHDEHKVVDMNERQEQLHTGKGTSGWSSSQGFYAHELGSFQLILVQSHSKTETW